MGSIIKSSGDITAYIEVGWLKERVFTRVLCDKNVLMKLKGKFSRVAIRRALLYDYECWPLRKAQKCQLDMAKMRMLRWMCILIMADQIPNDPCRRALGVKYNSKKYGTVDYVVWTR